MKHETNKINKTKIQEFVKKVFETVKHYCLDVI